ncbi:lichenan operon transcriptional antiterminator [Breznakia sp. PF5-3]|uniref:BglG family transcription antiterminator n=1 Tax=unclassified Breznakia TaxID=2623764 RepID=UPI002404EC37|nr:MULTISPECIES: PRD domain-containing protein [unclassified Breznakia]MDF9824807.1 lichenan operon transcriptional antiterminator [Breznakia sp. PM6-1]MDF9835737.1 lichenan operon transcriptional antiterminator [Breznakia sp. PF5-3]MDF9837823.1 lichenan operon transcriptional antiterminator [Breznakia sp. PFB2-8]MDF9859806.1 lichenan operon transcriptional antiterminator [Breznakia sp. PH5-24]
MKKKHIELINYLCEQTRPTTSKELSNALGVSVRSIKNYVNTLNIQANEKIILSSNTGYTIHKSIALKLLDHQDTQIPQTSEERAFYIVKQILVAHTSHLDLYELCESLYVSYSTLKADIAKMNKAFSNFHIEFVCENDTLKIIGSEKNKRKLVSYVIYEETNNKFMNADIIKDSFQDMPIDKINNVITKTFNKYNYYINDFANINLLLHIVIIIDRIKEGNIVNQKNADFVIEDENEHSLVFELCALLEKEFDIKFNKSEQYEIYMLFKTNANYSLPSSQDTLRKIVGSDIIHLANDIIEKVNEYYYINLGNENFLTPFTLHLKNLILRAKNGAFTKNPMTQSIKTSCPTVYDIAIYISIELMDHYNIHINEDEVTFLALHIGAEIERQKTNDEKVKCILLCPEYMKISTQIYNQLLIEFGNQIDIIKTITSEEDLDKYSFSMCITTVRLQKKIVQDVIFIPPFLQQVDKVQIYDTINKIYNNRKNWILKSKFHQFFSAELFLANSNESTKHEVLHVLSSKMLDLNYVDETFEEKVLIRENAASTAFGNIAIPHAMKMEALKTSVSVCISKKGIHWNNQLVNIVLLVAINKADKRIFHDLYEALVELFSKEKVIQLVKECNTFTDFENLILENIVTEYEKT